MYIVKKKKREKKDKLNNYCISTLNITWISVPASMLYRERHTKMPSIFLLVQKAFIFEVILTVTQTHMKNSI